MKKRIAAITAVATAAVTAIIIAAKFAIGKEAKKIAEQADANDLYM